MNNQIISILDLERKFRSSKNIDELFIYAVNHMMGLVKYDTAIAFLGQKSFKAISHSNLPDFKKNSNFIKQIEKKLLAFKSQHSIEVINSGELSKELISQGMNFSLIVPLLNPSNKTLLGMIIFNSKDGFSKESLAIMEHCSETISLVVSSLSNNKKSFQLKSKIVYLAIGLVIFLVSIIPVNLSTYGKAQVVAREPLIITAPMNAVIKKVYVKSNDEIQLGDRLVSFDDTEMAGKQKIAAQSINISSSEITKQERASFFDASIKNRLEETKAEKAVKSLEYGTITTQLKKLNVYAPSNGVIILDDPMELIGKPVKTGEKLLSIANPNNVEIEILIPTHEANDVSIGNKVAIYLDNNPMNSLIGTISKIMYEPVLAPSNVLSYKAYARIDNDKLIPAIGMCGNVKIKGLEVPLIWYILRKPIAYVRWYFG